MRPRVHWSLEESQRSSERRHEETRQVTWTDTACRPSPRTSKSEINPRRGLRFGLPGSPLGAFGEPPAVEGPRIRPSCTFPASLAASRAVWKTQEPKDMLSSPS